ncbi:TetR family transcriptional regulator [Acinetobacter nematophilus]|uniref:TetR family transcriptional regulator n=1 Tax=Acinetobacter nematophilus TaxID=2994642 RepID=A0A9X3DRC6_9GAMM|nr:TetR family transcriptional regulator [Acinetobacter nematophilus]MCX5466621.1 TetR family transcriptional regulator [Acinetobacter nematophilus]
MDIATEACRKQYILDRDIGILAYQDDSQLTIDAVVMRVRSAKSTIYRWWEYKSDLLLDAFKVHADDVLDMDFEQNLEHNSRQQLLELPKVLPHQISRALLLVQAERREAAGDYIKQHFLPCRERRWKLIQLVIQAKESSINDAFELLLDTLYAPIHYQTISFNSISTSTNIDGPFTLVLAPVRYAGSGESYV